MRDPVSRRNPRLTYPARGEGLDRACEVPVLQIRVDMFFLGGAGMRYRAVLGVADGLGVAPEGAGLVVVLARLPALAAGRQLGVAERERDGALIGVDGDEVAVAEQ